MIDFWLAAGLLLLVALSFLLIPVLRGRRAQREEDRTALNVALYQERVAELQGQQAEGVLTSDQMDSGRAEARAIGATLHDLAIPIGDVLASPYCRTMETAQLMFGRAEATPAVRGGPAQPESPTRYAELRELLARPVPPGTKLVITSHGNPYRAVAGGDYLAEGEAAVIEPRGAAGFRIVARVRGNEWKELALR